MRASRASRNARRARRPSPSPRSPSAAEPEFDETAADELVAALAGGAALTFEPDADDDDGLLPGGRPLAEPVAPASEATPDEIAAELAREAAEKEETAAAG